ncbi:MAG: hypothetical protein APR54_05875 [Candidatus Cloacimonas sp. SDB]|nr:MAG: hypothetical protein APR54_05875 [Candidatus Cloacimonas sp. SDB]
MFIYNLFLSIIYFISLPVLIFKFKGNERKERFGRIKLDYTGVIWIHAASVGEVNAVKPLIIELLTKFPSRHFVLSTMTSTGQQAAENISPKLSVFYFPLDFLLPMIRIFNWLEPEMIILVETELWPNLLLQAKKRNIPVVIVNGRISDRSFPSYRRFLFFWKPLWKSVIAVNAQSSRDADRFRILKFRNVKDTQNLKFCLKLPEYDSDKIRAEMGYLKEDFIIVWGSSRPGEEKLFKQVICQLKTQMPDLRAVLVPRHLSRLAEIKQIFSDVKYSVYSESNKPDWLVIVDEMNILPMFYAISDIAIIGGSFYNFGGHNPLEAAFYATPIIMGKYYHSCRDSVEKLIEEKAVKISNPQDLSHDILNLYENKDETKKMGINAKLTLTKNSDSLKKNLEILERIFNYD